MAEFETVLLSSLLADEKAIAVGVMYPGEDTPSGIPLIRVADIVDGRISSTVGYRISEEVNYQYRRTQLLGDEVLMTLVGRPGIAIKVPAEVRGWNAARALAVLRLADPEERDFFVYAIASPQVQHTIRNWCNTTVQATLNLKEIKALPLPWPDRKTRRATAATLGALDDKIELNRKMNATLEAMARALFRDWFVDFGPTRAKMEGREPYLSPDLWSLFPDGLDAEGNPEGWTIRTLGEVADQIAMGPFGSNIKVETFVEEGIPIISGAHLRGLQLSDKDYKFVTEAHADKLGRSNVRRGDVVFTHAGNIGQVAIVPETAEYDRYVISQRQFYMRCNLQLMSPLYVVHYFHSPEGKHTLLANSSQVGVPSIARPATYLKSIEICCPHKALLDEFERVVSSIHLKVGKNESESRTLAQTRDLLLPRLMSGELRVDSALYELEIE